MSLLDQLRDRIAAAVAPRKNDRPYIRSGGSRNIGATQTGGELAASLRGTVFACLQHRANALTGVKFDTYAEKNWKREELGRGHWANELLNNPNPYFTRSQVFSYIENWLSINGNAFIWTPTNGYRVPLQMWVLNPTRMRVIKGDNNFIEGYVYQSAQEGNIAIPEKEVIHLAKIHPGARPEEIIGMNIFGVGLVSAALEYAFIDREVSAYLARLFENNTVPPLVATFPERFDADEWHKLKAAWNEELPDYKLRALLGGGMQLQLPPKGELSISYDAVSRDTRAQIAQVFGVPPGMLDGSFQNRATAEVQFAIFRQNTIDPEALYIAEEFTRHFRRWEEDILIEAQPYEYADPDADMRKEEFELKWGLKTINEARAARGYDPIKDGNIPLIAGGYAPLQSVVNPAPLPVVPRKLERGYNVVNRAKLPLITAESKDLFWRNYDGLTTIASNNITPIVEQMIETIQDQVFEQIESGAISMTDVTVSLDELVDFEEAIFEACETVKQELLTQFSLGTEDLSGAVGQEIQALTTESANKIRESIGVIKEDVQKTLIANSSKTKDELFDVLKTQFTSLKTSRARMIANTTAANVTSGMQHTVYKDLGFKMMWLTQRDSKVRPSHARLDGSFQDGKGKFTVENQEEDTEGNITTTIETTDRPLGRGLSASNAINCRCQLFPVEE
jgi:HK97 family phage portal protein